MSTHHVETTLTIRVRVHVPHGYIHEKQFIRECKNDVYGYLKTRWEGVYSSKGWTIEEVKT